VVLFHGSAAWRYIGYLAAVAARRIEMVKGITVLRANQVELSHAPDDRVFVQVDGEFAGHLPARVEIVPDSLSLLVPPQYVLTRSRRAVPDGCQTTP